MWMAKKGKRCSRNDVAPDQRCPNLHAWIRHHVSTWNRFRMMREPGVDVLFADCRGSTCNDRWYIVCEG